MLQKPLSNRTVFALPAVKISLLASSFLLNLTITSDSFVTNHSIPPEKYVTNLYAEQ
jgi:hypothetical protein